MATPITNGFNPALVLGALRNEVLWTSQGTSTSGRYFQDFHPLCDETIMKALPNTGGNYNTFLSSLNDSVILECVNACFNKPTIIDKPKLAFWRSQGNQLPLQYVATQNQFVGLRIYIGKGDTAVKLNSLQLFFSKAATFNLYLYNDMIIAPVLTMSVSCTAMEQVIIPLGTDIILNNLVPIAYKEGTWYLGYYQKDLPADCQAIYYPVGYNRFHPLTVLAFSAPLWIDPTGAQNFLRNNIGSNNLMYGMNLEISTYIDATNTIVQNPSLWDELIGLKMACKVIEYCKFSYQTSAIQRVVQGLGGLDELNTIMNGRPYDREFGKPKIIGLMQRVNDAVRTVKGAFENNISLIVS